uniref:Aryl hydrocarbon receptor nuclear translocator-like protein 1 n=1 Tax=Magallana gigas TaxID=29159 RepID=K1QQW6_MAGGI
MSGAKGAEARLDPKIEIWLVGVCRPVAQQNLINMQTYEDNNSPEWISQHAMDGKLWYQDHRVSLVTGLMPKESIGKSVYDLVRKEDLRDIACSHMKIMTDDEIPCTVFRMDSLDWHRSVKYIKARSVIVKDAWTKKNLFIVSLNQHISDEEGEALLIEQQRRVQALIAATKGLTLQEQNFEESSEVLSIASGSSQPESPVGAELPSICSSASRHSVDSWSDGDSAPSVTDKSLSKDKDTKKRDSLPLLKSLLIGPNCEKGTVNKLETLECRSQESVLPKHKQSGDQDSNVGKSSFSGEFFGESTGDSGIVSGFERQDVPYISIVDVDLLDENNALQQSDGISSPESFLEENNSAVDKEYFVNQISHFFPNVSSGGVLNSDSKQCGVDCSDKDLPSVSDSNIQKVQSPTISSQISPQTDNACVQDSSEVKVESRFYQQLQKKHDNLERSLHSQNQELTVLKRNLRDNQHYPHFVEKLKNLQVYCLGTGKGQTKVLNENQRASKRFASLTTMKDFIIVLKILWGLYKPHKSATNGKKSPVLYSTQG